MTTAEELDLEADGKIDFQCFVAVQSKVARIVLVVVEEVEGLADGRVLVLGFEARSVTQLQVVVVAGELDRECFDSQFGISSK